MSCKPTTDHRPLTTVYCLLITALFACTSPTPQPVLQTSLYIYRFDPPAFVELGEDFQPIHEIPFSIPPHCGLFNVFAPPLGKFLAVELSCPNGQTVLFLDVDSASVTQPITDADSHFLAWTSDGKAAYLKADSMGSPHVVRAFTNGGQDALPITEFTYDLASSSNDGEFTFTFSRGLGQGSELWLTNSSGDVLLYSDQYNYISFARFSPDGKQIAFIKIPDTQTPFTVGELWLMGSDGSNPRKLAEVDAGHGYAANWSPDGQRIAFVVRENSEDENADQSSGALISNIYIADVANGALTPVTHLVQGHVEAPFWSPEGNTLAFNMVINDRMEVRSADLTTGEIQPLIAESACCPAWMRK